MKNEEQRGGWWFIWIPGGTVAAVLGLFGFHGHSDPQPTWQDQSVARTQAYRCEASLMQGGFSYQDARNSCEP